MESDQDDEYIQCQPPSSVILLKRRDLEYVMGKSEKKRKSERGEQESFSASPFVRFVRTAQLRYRFLRPPLSTSSVSHA